MAQTKTKTPAKQPAKPARKPATPRPLRSLTDAQLQQRLRRVQQAQARQSKGLDASAKRLDTLLDTLYADLKGGVSSKDFIYTAPIFLRALELRAKLHGFVI